MPAPFTVTEIDMDGTWIAVKMNPAWTAVNIQARASVNLSLSHLANGSKYRTIKAGTSLTLDTDFDGENIYLQGTSGVVVELLAQTRN